MQKPRILVVDDEPDFTKLMKMNLERIGSYEVWMVNSAVHALSTAKAFQPQLIFLDLALPDGDGADIAAQIRADPQLTQAHVVFLTASVTQEEIDAQGHMRGGFPFLAKPIQRAELLACLLRYLGPPLQGD